jgi:hypothetical protein
MFTIKALSRQRPVTLNGVITSAGNAPFYHAGPQETERNRKQAGNLAG